MKITQKNITRAFLLGLFTLIPSAFTIWVVWMLLATIDHVFKHLFLIFIPEGSYISGFGLLTAIIISLGVGIAMQATALPRLVNFIEKILLSLPLIKTVYSAFKDFSDYLSGQKKEKLSRVVTLPVPNSDYLVLGMVTQECPEQDLGKVASDKLLVYCPMSYQIGGYTLLVNKKDVEPISIPVEDAMRYILTAGISRAKRKPNCSNE